MISPGLAAGPPAAGPSGHASPQQTALIMRLMHGPPPAGEPDADDQKHNGAGMSPLAQVQSLIQDVHDAMRNIQDPQIVNVLSGCLKALTGVQQQLMTQSGGK